MPLGISDDGRLVAFEDAEENEEPRRIRVVRRADGQELQSLHTQGESIFCVEFLDSNRRLGTFENRGDIGNEKHWLVIWDIKSGRRETEIPVKMQTYLYAFSPDGSLCAVEAEEGLINVWDTRLRSVRFSLDQKTCSHFGMAFSKNGRLLAASGEGRRPKKNVGEIRVWDSTSGKELATIIDDTSWGVTAVEFSPDGRELAAGNASGIVRFWNVPTVSGNASEK